jgi:hypothetical protein
VEILVNDRAAERAGLATAGLERRLLELKGKTQPTGVFVVGAGRRGRVDGSGVNSDNPARD